MLIEYIMSVNNIVRYSAKQGTFDTVSNTLVDVEIPSGSGTWNLSKCYISVPVRPIYTETTTGAPVGFTGDEPKGVYSASLIVDCDGNSATRSLLCPPTQAILVKNAECFSSTKGRVASGRRVDALRTALAVYEKDELEAIDDPCGINTPPRDNIWTFGEMSELTGRGTDPSIEHTHEIKIYLRDIFNFASVTSYDSSPSAMGALRIHLETNFKLLKAVSDVNAATFAENQDANNALPDYGAIDAYANPGAGGQALTYAMTTAKYESVEDSPYWVGMKCLITNAVAGGGGAGITNAIVKIKSITQNTGVAGPLNPTSAGAAAGNKGKLFIEFATTGYGAAMTNGQSRAAGTLVHTPAAAVALEIDSCDLVAVSSEDEPQNEVDYTEWVLQEDSLAAGSESSYARSYHVPPNCMSAVVLHTANPAAAAGVSMYSADQWAKYRVAFNNEPLTALDVQAGSAQHYDLIRKAFVNRGRSLKCVEEKIQSLDGRRVGEARANSGRSRAMVFPVPLSGQSQMMELQVETVAGQSFSGPIKVYWEVVKSV